MKRAFCGRSTCSSTASDGQESTSFFVLSGFLIGGLLIREVDRRSTVDTKRFLLRRLLRIWPAYYCFVILAIVRTIIEQRGKLGATMASFWPALVHIQNFREVPRTQL